MLEQRPDRDHRLQVTLLILDRTRNGEHQPVRGAGANDLADREPFAGEDLFEELAVADIGRPPAARC
jgi:hypothetical protein